MNKLLARQLKRAFKITDPSRLASIQAELEAITLREGSRELQEFASNLPRLLDMVDRAYDQHNRDLTLRTRSLELSSGELQAANDRLRGESNRIRGLLDALVAATNRLMAETGLEHREHRTPTPEELCDVLLETSEALSVARRRAEAASAAKSVFMATMCHEIRTPMNGVLGMVQLLARTALNSTQHGYVHRLRGSAEHLLHIIDDILDFSRMEAGKMELELAPFLPRVLLEEIRGMLEAKANEKGLELRLVTTGLDLELLGDSHRIRQILINLVGNAIKFTDTGSVSIECSTTAAGEDRARARFVVKDTGCGMSPEVCKRIFEAFVQADGSMARQYGGSGLGLAISQRLANAMGGDLTVESEVGRGSTFTLELVTQRAVPLATPAESKPDRNPTELPSGLRVLVVEDNPVNQFVVTEMLDLLGVRFEVAVDGVAAVKTLREDRTFDLVLMDCQMPRMNGYEATRVIRQEEGGGHLPIVGLTANALPEDREQSLEAGMDDFLAKPFSMANLERVLAEWCTQDPQGHRER